MSQRQVRIDGQAQIRKSLTELVNKRINIVLTNNTVTHGKLVRIESDVVIIKNMRLKPVQIPIETIFEIYSDKEA